MALYDRLRDNQMPLGINRLDRDQFQSSGTDTYVTDPPRPYQASSAQNVIDLGGGLGSIPVPQFTDLDLQRLNDYLVDLNPSIFGIRSDTFDEYLRDQEEREAAQEEQVDTGLEDTGVSEEVISDVVDLDEAPVMPTVPSVGAIDSVTGEVIPEEDVILTTMPVGDPVRFVPPPPPVTDVVTGEEMPLITPVVDVPQDSLTGLGSFFTAPEIEQIVNPPAQGSYPTDMNKLLQMQSSFLNFLGGDGTTNVVPGVTTIGEPTDGTTGYMGEGYVPGETYQPITFGNPYTYTPNYNPYSINNPYYSPVMDQVQRYNFTNMPTNVGQGYYGDLYGGLVFPDFSGITSLVPYDARQEII